MFGPPTWRRPLRTGDHVLALTDHSETDSVIVSRVLSTRHALHAFTHTHNTHTHTQNRVYVCLVRFVEESTKNCVWSSVMERSETKKLGLCYLMVSCVTPSPPSPPPHLTGALLTRCNVSGSQSTTTILL